MVPKKEEMRFCFQQRFLSFQESSSFLKILVLITQKRGGLLFMHRGFEHCRFTSGRNDKREKITEVTLVVKILSWLEQGTSSQKKYSNSSDSTGDPFGITYFMFSTFLAFEKKVENTIVICGNIWQWNWVFSILLSIQKKYTGKIFSNQDHQNYKNFCISNLNTFLKWCMHGLQI